MSVNRRKIRFGYAFRHFGKQYTKKVGLYFGNSWGTLANDDWRKLSDSEVIEIRDWLSRYINTYIHQKTSPLIPDMKAKNRSIHRGLEKLEAQP